MPKNKFNDGIKFALNKLYWKLPEKWANFIIAEMNDTQPWTNAEFYFDEQKGEIRYKQKSNENKKRTH